MLESLIATSVCLALTPPLVFFAARALARARERRVLAAPRPPRPRQRASGALVLLAALFGLGTVLGVLAVGLPSGPRMLAVLGGAVLVLLAWIAHTVPGHSRAGKYGLLAVGGILTSMMPTSGERLARLSPTDPFLLGTAALSGLVIVASLVYALLVIRPDAPLEGASSRAAHAWWRRLSFIQGPDPLSMLVYALLSLVGLAPAYLLLRFAAKAKLSQHPFLYLRSFRNDASPEVLAALVGPALSRRGTFVGLVHASQPQSSLQSGVPLLWSANFATVGDAQWQEWVVDAMSRAKGVIIDISGDTPGLRWEIAQARERVEPSRILVLRDAPGPALGQGITEVVYDLDAGLAAARSEVAAFGARVNASFGVEDPAPTTFSRRRWSIGGLGVALGYSAVLLLLTVPAFFAVQRLTANAARPATLFAMRDLARVVTLHQLQHRRPPERLDELDLPERPLDGWGNALRYEANGGDFDIVSYGSDGRPGGTGDAEDLRWSEIR